MVAFLAGVFISFCCRLVSFWSLARLTSFARLVCRQGHYSKRGKYCCLNSPGAHLCKFIARFGEMNSPESQICNSVGPCSRHRKLLVSDINYLGQTQINKEICNVSEND